MQSFQAVRMWPMVDSRPDITIRHPPRTANVMAHPMRIGSKALDAFGFKDNWLPGKGNMLPPYRSEVLTISEAFVSSATGIVGLQTGEVLEDTLDHTDPERDRYVRIDGYEILCEDGSKRRKGGTVFLPRPQANLKGRYLSLLLGNYDNHFHWLLMSFARVALLLPENFEHLCGILVPANLSRVHQEALHLARLTDHAPLRAVRRGESLQIATLILPWNIASGSGVDPAAAVYLHHLVSTQHNRKSSYYRRRLYIDRRNASLRRLMNENEIVDMLLREGIKPVQMEGLSLVEQAHLLQDAELVIGPHGAGLANMVFSTPGTRIIELMPSGVMNWCYRHLAAACRHDYDCVIGRSLPVNGIAPIWAPWIVSPTYVQSALQTLVAS